MRPHVWARRRLGRPSFVDSLLEMHGRSGPQYLADKPVLAGEGESVAMQLAKLYRIHHCTVAGGGSPRVRLAQICDFPASTRSHGPVRAHNDRDTDRRDANSR